MSRVESMRIWQQISYFDTPPHSAGARELRDSATCTLVFWSHKRRQRSSKMQYAVLFRLPSLKDIPQSTNVLLFLDFNWEQRQLSTRLRSLLLSYDGSQVLTNLRMLMVTVILNFKYNLERTQDPFWVISWNTYYVYFVLYAQLFYLYISSSITMYYSTPPCLHTQTVASQPRHHYQPTWRTRTASAGTRHTTKNAQKTFSKFLGL